MKIHTFVLLAAAAMSTSTAIAAQDRASENRAAVRGMFPIVSLFDKKKPASEQAVTLKQNSSQTSTTGDPVAAMNALAISPGDARDVAGIRLGMTPAQVRAAAATAGYSRIEDQTQTQYGWASVVRQEEETRSLPKLYPASAAPVLGTEVYKGSGSQKLKVSYTPTPSGLYVYSVRYSVNMSETPWDTMKERARAKYGRETYATASTLTFCAQGERKCDVFGQFQRPSIQLDFMPGASWLTYEQGIDYRNAYASARNAEVDRLHPMNERPAF